MTQDKLLELESQQKYYKEEYDKTMALINRNKATQAELLRKNDKDIRMLQNAKLIEIGKIICASINADPLDINTEDFQDFINHTWATFYSSGMPLSKTPGYYFNDYKNVWQQFMTTEKRNNFIKKK